MNAYFIFFSSFFLFLFFTYWKTVTLLLTIILLYFLIKFPRNYDIKITFFTYIGAISYFGFYILFFLFLRLIYIHTPLDLKNIPIFIDKFFKIYNKSLETQIFFTFFSIVCIMLWIYIFIKINKRLSYHVWQIYLYNEQKYLLQKIVIRKSLLYTYPIEKFLKFSIYGLSSFLIDVFQKGIKYLNWPNGFNYLQNLPYIFIVRIIKIFVFLILIIIFIYDCYINNYILIYTKYFLLFYMIFHLWCKLSTFAQFNNIGINMLLFRRAYCFPKMVFINLTEKEEESLLMYCKGIRFKDGERVCLLRDVAIKKLYYAQDPNQYFYYDEEGNNKPMTYLCFYENDWIHEGFPDTALIEKKGKYFVKIEENQNNDNIF